MKRKGKGKELLQHGLVVEKDDVFLMLYFPVLTATIAFCDLDMR